MTLHTTLQGVGIEQAYGPSIILFTLILKLLTFPLNKQQIESTSKMQAIQPAAKALQEKYNKLTVTPTFNEGDLFLFDEYYVHTTQFHFGDHKPGVYRYAIETWFHSRCTVDNDYSTPMAFGW